MRNGTRGTVSPAPHFWMKIFLFVFCLVYCTGAVGEIYFDLPSDDWYKRPLIRLTAFDTAQSDCMLLECGGEAMMIDGGTGQFREKLRDEITARGISHFKYLLNTHFHEDHVTGLTWLMHYGFGVGEYLHPYNESGVRVSARHAEAIKEAKKQNIPIRQVFHGDTLMLGEAVVSITRYDDGASTNGRSLVIRVDFGDASMLLPADIIGHTQTWLVQNFGADLLDVDILKAPHHGITAMVPKFLEAASPLALLMNNDFDRVDKGRTQADNYGIPTYYSGEGRVVFESDGDDWYVYQLQGHF